MHQHRKRRKFDAVHPGARVHRSGAGVQSSYPTGPGLDSCCHRGFFKWGLFQSEQAL